MVTIARRTVDPGTDTNATQRAQIVAAARAGGFEVTTVGQALAAFDRNEVHQTELWDASNRRAYTAFEYGAGDTSGGMIFEQGTTTAAARIDDGDLVDCVPRWGDEMRECREDADCRAMRCWGRSDELRLGRCLLPSRDTHESEGTECRLESGCPPGSGLVCAGAPSRGEGLCLPAWMKGRFLTTGAVAIPDGATGGAEIPLGVYGLSTVDMDVLVDLDIVHPRPADLLVTLTNPATAEVVVLDGAAPSAPGELIVRDLVVRGFSGDEQVNGLWRLKVVDRRRGEAGTVVRFGLTITSRWD
jgi:subtilisin-like proprotein convertase family protein